MLEGAVTKDAEGRMAEWSKALALGASPQGRGFEPHFCHFLLFYLSASVQLCTVREYGSWALELGARLGSACTLLRCEWQAER